MPVPVPVLCEWSVFFVRASTSTSYNRALLAKAKAKPKPKPTAKCSFVGMAYILYRRTNQMYAIDEKFKYDIMGNHFGAKLDKIIKITRRRMNQVCRFV